MKASPGSLSHRLGQLAVGESFWMEIPYRRIHCARCRAAEPMHRRPLDTIGKKFSSSVVRVVMRADRNDQDVTLIRYTRTA